MFRSIVTTSLWALALCLCVPASGFAQYRASAPAGEKIAEPFPMPLPSYAGNAPELPPLSGVRLNGQQIDAPPVPSTQVAPVERKRLEHTRNSGSVIVHQWSAIDEVPPEVLFSEAYMRTRDDNVAGTSLKEAIYLALRNNPAIQADALNPLASLQSVRQSNAAFDPDLTSRLDQLKSVSPTTSVLQTGGASAFSFKQYDWNFAANKLLSSTNGTLSLAFNNNRQASNSAFSAVNPSYNPGLTVSLSQPLLRNFGWGFATINVKISELNQKQSQFQFEQNLSDFIQHVADDYWGVVRGEENLQVAREAYKLAQDLVRQNEISVRVGVLAPLDIKEAQSEEATRAADVYSADNTLAVARAALRQDVMLNPSHLFLPAQIEPSERPSPTESIAVEEEQSLELAMQYRPELAALRQNLRSMLLQVKFAENQTLPQFNVGTQIGISATAGSNKCTSNFSPAQPTNCVAAGGTPGSRLPFGGIYGDALDKMFGMAFYNYAVVFNLERPLMNDAAKSALAQAKIEYEQMRLQYRALISQIVLDVQTALSSVSTGVKRVHATRVAAEYARESLRAEQERYRVGMANTHELLQFQDSLVSALGNQVQAQVDLEIAKLLLKHSEGTLMRTFSVEFAPQDPHDPPWYARF